MNQILRYGLNGLLATAIHYSVLSLNIEVFKLPSAAIANAVAAIFGIATSYLGSRYFVFRARIESISKQLPKFLLLYLTIAVLHATVLYIWTDQYALDYRIGFLLATSLQMLLSFFGNKRLVF